MELEFTNWHLDCLSGYRKEATFQTDQPKPCYESRMRVSYAHSKPVYSLEGTASKLRPGATYIIT